MEQPRGGAPGARPCRKNPAGVVTPTSSVWMAHTEPRFARSKCAEQSGRCRGGAARAFRDRPRACAATAATASIAPVHSSTGPRSDTSYICEHISVIPYSLTTCVRGTPSSSW